MNPFLSCPSPLAVAPVRESVCERSAGWTGPFHPANELPPAGELVLPTGINSLEHWLDLNA